MTVSLCDLITVPDVPLLLLHIPIVVDADTAKQGCIKRVDLETYHVRLDQ